jgi:interleukin-1 receptor-associated kinase 1
VKSDVYGFGIVLVEMLTGKSVHEITRTCQKSSLLDWLKSDLLNRGKMRSTMDARLEGKYPSKLALKVAQLALKCIRDNPKVRPSMKEVFETLEQIQAANDKPADNMKKAIYSRTVQLQHCEQDGT